MWRQIKDGDKNMLERIKEINELANDIIALSNDNGLEIIDEAETAAVFSPVQIGKTLQKIKDKSQKIANTSRKIFISYQKRGGK